jgi:hypothetical protein
VTATLTFSNSTHQVVPVTEMEEKDEAKVDPVT